jgi:hypothetical protein
MQFHSRRVKGTTALVDLRAAALNQDDENDDKQNSGNDPDQSGAIHCDSSFLKRL